MNNIKKAIASIVILILTSLFITTFDLDRCDFGGAVSLYCYSILFADAMFISVIVAIFCAVLMWMLRVINE